MPIPVPVPGSPLSITDTHSTRAEAFLSALVQVLKNGTTGATTNTPATTVPSGNDPTSLVALNVALAKEQLFLRSIGVALTKSLTPVKAGAQVNGSTSAPTTSSATFVVIPEMTSTVSTNGGNALAVFSGTFNIQAADSFDYAIFLDGVEVSGTRRTANCATAIAGYNASTQALLTSLSAGSHTIDVRWKMNAGTARAVGILRNLVVSEQL